MGDVVSDVAEAGKTTLTLPAIIELIKTAVTGVFDIASSAFSFLISNPLAAFMLGTGFAFTALSCVRKGLRIAKRA